MVLFVTSEARPGYQIHCADIVTSLRVLDGAHTSKSKQVIQWIYPKCNKQIGGWECGYYVMNWMWNIIQAGIAENWTEVLTGFVHSSDGLFCSVACSGVAGFTSVVNRCEKGHFTSV
ncbi:hypothetical protein OROGR_025430 [Orobanche gracilis]